MNNLEKALKILGIGKRSGNLFIGTDTVINNLQNKKVKIVILAKDSSNLTIETLENKCHYYNIPIDLSFSCEEISQAVGKENIKVVALCDQGLKESFEKLVKDGALNESKRNN